MRLTIPLLASVALASLVSVGSAGATVIATYSPIVPVDHYVAPTSTTGTVFLNETGTVSGKYKSPFSNGTSPYVAVEKGFATYAVATSKSVSLVWGTPDSYNTVLFFSGTTLVGSITGSSIGPGNGTGNYFADLTSTASFDKIEFASTQPAFEFSNVTVSVVPLPTSLPLFGAALLGFAAIGYGMKKKTSASV